MPRDKLSMPDPAKILATFKPEGGPRVIAARARGQDVAIVLNLYRGPSASVVLAFGIVFARFV